MDPSWLVGRGAPQPKAGPDIPTPGDTPDRTPSLQGQRPALTAITMAGLAGQPGGESITFTFADGFKATETFAELVHLGFPRSIVGAMGQAFDHAGDLVYATNHGAGATAR
jgi:hypothetical protein